MTPSRMRVPHFAGEGRIDWTEKPVPEPGPGQLLVRVRANAICGSERGQFYRGTGVTPGHEAAGIVAAAGPETRTTPGTPGVIFLMDFCGDCRSCQRGATNQCQAKRADMGFSHDGGYGAYALISERIFFPMDADIPPAEATLLLDIMGTGGHALARGRRLCPEPESVLIAGAGPIGLGVLAMTRLLLGPDVPVVITDVVPYRLDLAARLGATPVNVRETKPAPGFDLALDTSGNSAAIRDCLSAFGARGTLVAVGHGAGMTLDVSADLIHPERAVIGSEYFPFADLAGNLQRLRAHRAYLTQIITHRFPVADVQRAFETFFSGETGKVIVEQ